MRWYGIGFVFEMKHRCSPTILYEMGYFTGWKKKSFLPVCEFVFIALRFLNFYAYISLMKKRSSGLLMAVEVMNVLEKPGDKSNLWTFVSQTLLTPLPLRRLYDLSLKTFYTFILTVKNILFSSKGVGF